MPSEIINIPLGKWQPDTLSHELAPGDLITCKNVVAGPEGYVPFLNPSVYIDTAFTGIPRSGKSVINSSGVTYTFIGTASSIHRVAGTTLTTPGTGFTTGDETWHWALFGQWIIGTNYISAPQVLKDLASGTFVALGGTPPRAKYMLFNSGHLILGNIYDTIARPRTVKWCAINDVETWAISNLTGADEQDMADSDTDITGMTNLAKGEFAIFHRESITKGWYSKSPYFFSFNENHVKGIGAIPNTMVTVGDTSFFFGYNDIYYFDGNTVTPIGGGVKKTVLNNMNPSYYNRINAIYRPDKRAVYWLYPSSISAGTPDTLLCLDIATMKFSLVPLNAHCILMGSQGAITDFDALDSIYTLAVGGVDAIPYDLDSLYWLTNTPVLFTVNGTSGKIQSHNVNNLSGLIETGDYRIKDTVNMVTGVRVNVLGEGSPAITLKTGHRYKSGDNVTYSDSLSIGPRGWYEPRVSGQLLRLQLTTGPMEGLSSVDIKVTPRGTY